MVLVLFVHGGCFRPGLLASVGPVRRQGRIHEEKLAWSGFLCRKERSKSVCHAILAKLARSPTLGFFGGTLKQRRSKATLSVPCNSFLKNNNHLLPFLNLGSVDALA